MRSPTFFPNPLLLRQLTSAARRARLFVLLTLYLTAFGLIILLISATTLAFSTDLGEITLSMRDLFRLGQLLFWGAGLVLLLTAWILTPISVLGAIAGEREQRTLDLLQTTTLTPFSIAFGKLTGALFQGALYLLAPFPLLMMGFWLGGITLAELGITIFFLLVTLLANNALALWLSSLTRKTVTAVFLFYLLTLGSSLGIGLLQLLLALLTSIISELPATTQFWAVCFTEHGWILLSALHPLTAAVASQALAAEHHTWLWVTLPVAVPESTLVGTFSVVSPWIPYTLLALLTTLVLLRATARRLARPAKR